ncbi:MAG: SDR family oxidoreductase [Bacteroidales bacterium]|nr:SDR family oxidoreductase [Bacteroidales bacterium]MBN2762618.1 SDR family oxidoreductase [Bacteroidales bacterium]
MKIKDKIIWITGASSGIGEALSILAVSSGARVILSARSVTRLETLKKQLEAISPGSSSVVPLDVTKPEEINKAVDTVTGQFERIDILINNAGISQRSLAIETPVEVDRMIMEADFFGAVTLTKALLPFMIRQGGGHLVTISSMTGLYGFPMRSGYSAAKHALRGFFETVALELWNQHIRVTLVYPGRVRTDISINSLTKDGKKYNLMDPGQARGIPAKICAKRIIKAVEKNKKELMMGTGETFLYYMKKYIPPVFYLIARRTSPT